jgi:hypothetical protein
MLVPGRVVDRAARDSDDPRKINEEASKGKKETGDQAITA